MSMDTLENKAPAQNEVSELREQVESLRHLVGSILILLVVVSGTFNIFLLRQWKTSKTELTFQKPQVANLVAVYQKNEQPAIENFIKKMVEYGQTHADFAPILNKYQIKAAPPPSGATSPAPPVPGASAPSSPISPAAAPQKK
jgi:hypothetical protein